MLARFYGALDAITSAGMVAQPRQGVAHDQYVKWHDQSQIDPPTQIVPAHPCCQRYLSILCADTNAEIQVTVVETGYDLFRRFAFDRKFADLVDVAGPFDLQSERRNDQPAQCDQKPDPAGEAGDDFGCRSRRKVGSDRIAIDEITGCNPVMQSAFWVEGCRVNGAGHGLLRQIGHFQCMWSDPTHHPAQRPAAIWLRPSTVSAAGENLEQDAQQHEDRGHEQPDDVGAENTHQRPFADPARKVCASATMGEAQRASAQFEDWPAKGQDQGDQDREADQPEGKAVAEDRDGTLLVSLPI